MDDLLSYLAGIMALGHTPDVSQKKVHVNHKDCEGFGACKAACLAEAIYWCKDNLTEVDHEKCLTCGYCSPVFPARAIIVY